jgi:F-type H+-transporting ATPase subunit b
MSLIMDLSPFVEGAAASANSLSQPLLASVHVDLDKTVFIQMALFGILILILKPLLFDPMLRVFALREERTDGAKTEARKMQERAAEILSNYEAEIAKVRADATAERDRMRKETSQLEARILAEGREAAETIAADGRARIAEEMQAFQIELDEKTSALAGQIASRVLSREVP